MRQSAMIHTNNFAHLLSEFVSELKKQILFKSNFNTEYRLCMITFRQARVFFGIFFIRVYAKLNSPVRISILASVLRACSLLLPVSSIEPLLPDREVVLSSDLARMSVLLALLRRCLRSPRSSDLYLLSNFLYNRCPGTCLEDVLLCPSGESAKPAGGRTISSDTSR